MKRISNLLLCVILLCVVSVPVCANEHDSVMEELLINPRMTMNDARAAAEAAMKEGKSVELVDALMKLSSAQLLIDSDSISEVVDELNEAMNRCDNLIDRSLIALYMVQLYDSYQWDIYGEDSRPYIKDNPDILTWNARNFNDANDALLALALQPAEELKGVPISQYSAVIGVRGGNEDEDNTERWAVIEAFFPTMYDFVAWQVLALQSGNSELSRHIDILTIEALIAFHAERGDTAAQFAWSLLRITECADRRENETAYRTALDELIAQYASHDYVIEAVIERCDVVRDDIDDSPAKRRSLYDELKMWIDRYPHYYRTDCLREICSELSARSLRTAVPTVNYPDEPIVVDISYENVETAQYRLLRYDNLRWNGIDGISTRQPTTLLKDTVVTLGGKEALTFEEHTTTLQLPALPVGVYRLESQMGDETEVSDFMVTSYMLYVVETTVDELVVVLVDNKTGQPVKGERINLLSRDNEVLQRAKSDADGVCRFKREELIHFYYIALDNIARCPYTLSTNFMSEHSESQRPEVQIFTDRAIYRPGQELHFSALVYRLDSEVRHVVAGEQVDVELLDNSRNVVWSDSLVTDEYGSVSGSLELPQETAMGEWSIVMKVDGYTHRDYITVTEYKRPQFYVAFDPIEGAYSYGDTVHVSGRVVSYSGAPIAMAEVKYELNRHSYNHHTTLLNGHTTTDAEGRFDMQFLIEDAPDDEMARWWGVRYVVDAVVTSSTGESQEGSAEVRMSGEGVNIAIELPGVMRRDETQPVDITLTNSMGVALQQPMSVKLYKLQDAEIDTPLGDMKVQDEPVWQCDYAAGACRVELPYSELSSGAYRIVVSTTTVSGKSCERSANFILYSHDDKQPPIATALWCPVVKQQATDGKRVTLTVGSSFAHASLLYIVKEGDEIVQMRRLPLDNSVATIDLTYKKSYGDVVKIALYMVRNKKMYSREIVINRQLPDNKLIITPTTFRDKTQAGSSEKWQFTVRNATTGEPVDALFMAEMYDASLDALAAHAWSFDNLYRPPMPYMYVKYYWRADNDDVSYISALSEYIACEGYVPTVRPYLANYLIDKRFDALPDGVMMMMKSEGQRITSASGFAEEGYAEEEVAMSNDAAMDELSPNDDVAAGSDSSPATIRYRENMNETAFFYPHLVTDKQGNVVVEFTLPESNTTWNFFSMAVTPDLFCGSYNAQVISSKPLMVMPNMPRFVRQGDEVVLAVMVQNTTDEPLQGEARVEIYNPADERVITTLVEPFATEANGSTAMRFSFAIPDTLSLLGVRVGASTTLYSDGEQQLLAILPATQLVTETKPFYIPTTVSDTTIIFDDMQQNMQRETVGNYRLTLEYCDNPVWMAVTALPSLAEPCSNSVTAYAASLYANTVALGIVAGDPDIAHAIVAWSEKTDTVALSSQLLLNEELKQMLLSQTPWVLDAQNATEQLQQIASLLDAEKAQRLNHKVVAELQDLQGEAGGWSWFKDMPPSFRITLDVANTLSRVAQWGETEESERLTLMAHNALRYLDREYLARNERDKGVVDYYDICYMYVRSAYMDVPLGGDALSMLKQQMDAVEKSWAGYDLVEKAYLAIALQRYGREATALAMVNSLRQYAVTTEGQGMFWPNNRSHAFYHNSAVQVHCAVYEAFAAISPVTAELDAMRQWLLMQKQTQAWSNVPSTLDAANILLTSGSDWLHTGRSAQLQWGNKPLPTATQAKDIMGYEKYVRGGSEIASDDAVVTIESHGQHPSWGAMYWQYYDKITEVEAHGNEEITLSRSYYVEREGELVPIENTTLHEGDVVTVYLRLYTDRDMHYMTLVDARPACFEPVSQLPQYEYSDGMWYYQLPEDAVNTFYFDHLARGTHVLQYQVYVDRQGTYQVGIATLQSYYAPQYAAHSAGNVVKVEAKK